VRRAAAKFGARIVADRPWTHQPGAQRTDTGHVSIAAEAARFTQGVPAHDVIVVADETGFWGDGLAYRTTEARPIAGTHGLTPDALGRPHEQWGARSCSAASWPAPALDDAARPRRLARRPRRGRGRDAQPLDRPGRRHCLSARPALRAGRLQGHAASPSATGTGSSASRSCWRRRAPSSVSPQPGFQHRHSELDTLGTDRPETRCRTR
jgi:hypothetical protein